MNMYIYTSPLKSEGNIATFLKSHDDIKKFQESLLLPCFLSRLSVSISLCIAAFKWKLVVTTWEAEYPSTQALSKMSTFEVVNTTRAGRSYWAQHRKHNTVRRPRVSLVFACPWGRISHLLLLKLWLINSSSPAVFKPGWIHQSLSGWRVATSGRERSRPLL